MICDCLVDEECQLVADALAYSKPVWKMKSKRDNLSVRKFKTQSCSLAQSSCMKQLVFKETREYIVAV